VSELLARRLAAQGIRDPRVLEAMARLPRERFVPPTLAGEADEDWPLPIGSGQTISQPYVVGFMTEQLALQGDERVLEIGTGSGYQTAILALLAREVFSIEIRPELAERAREILLDELRLENVRLRTGDGTLGWPEAAPFDGILGAAAAPEVPPALVDQLAPGGRLILPVGVGEGQILRLVERGRDGVKIEADLLPVRFVPLARGPASE
jgi:protein-L-isoaspartate(D-aspartate) O-methyltransferase